MSLAVSNWTFAREHWLSCSAIAYLFRRAFAVAVVFGCAALLTLAGEHLTSSRAHSISRNETRFGNQNGERNGSWNLGSGQVDGPRRCNGRPIYLFAWVATDGGSACAPESEGSRGGPGYLGGPGSPGPGAGSEGAHETQRTQTAALNDFQFATGSRWGHKSPSDVDPERRLRGTGGAYSGARATLFGEVVRPTAWLDDSGPRDDDGAKTPGSGATWIQHPENAGKLSRESDGNATQNARRSELARGGRVQVGGVTSRERPASMRGRSAVDRQAHNLEVGGSIPPLAPKGEEVRHAALRVTPEIAFRERSAIKLSPRNNIGAGVRTVIPGAAPSLLGAAG